MKRAFSFALFGAFLIVAWTQPANASRAITVHNWTKTVAHVDIIFYTTLCKSDRFALDAGGTWSNSIGICAIKSFTAWIEDPAGLGHACRPDRVGGTMYRIVVNRNPSMGYCTVMTGP